VSKAEHSRALFLFTVGLDHGPIGFDGRLVEESIGLLFPNLLTNTVDPLHQLHQLHDFGCVKPSAEISSGSWIWNSFSAKGIKIGLVGSAQLDVLEAGSSGEQIHRDIEHMIGFVIAQVQFKYRHGVVDVLSQFELLDHLHDDADAATRNGLRFLAQFKLRRSSTNRWRLKNSMAFVDALSDFPVAFS
jgi:hypothetical protein